MRHLISILLENETGALSRVVGMFSQRGYNIETITAAPTENPHMSRITISTIGDDVDLEQIKKQIHKLINVHTVSTLEDGKSENTIELELIFLKVKANNNAARENVKRIADIFDAKIVDLTPEVYTVCLSAGRNKINRLMKAMQESAEILETVRSGVVAISRGSKALGHKQLHKAFSLTLLMANLTTSLVSHLSSFYQKGPHFEGLLHLTGFISCLCQLRANGAWQSHSMDAT